MRVHLVRKGERKKKQSGRTKRRMRVEGENGWKKKGRERKKKVKERRGKVEEQRE